MSEGVGEQGVGHGVGVWAKEVWVRESYGVPLLEST